MKRNPNCVIISFLLLLNTFCLTLPFFCFFFSLCACVRACIQQIKFFTAEAGLFVRNLKFFSKIENILINRQLVDLLSDAAVNINTLVENANVIETPSDQRGVIDLIFGFDDHEYCLRRFLECRSCGVSKSNVILLFLFSFWMTNQNQMVLCYVFLFLRWHKFVNYSQYLGADCIVNRGI